MYTGGDVLVCTRYPGILSITGLTCMYTDGDVLVVCTRDTYLTCILVGMS